MDCWIKMRLGRPGQLDAPSEGPLDSARYHQYLTDFQANIARAYGREHLVDEFTNTLRQHYPSLSLIGDR